MTQLTKEYFDDHVNTLATKQDLESQTKELKTHTHEEVENLARIVGQGFESVEHRIDDLDLRRRVEQLEAKVDKLAGALRIKL